MSSSNDKVLGVVFLTRHGDRQGFYQSPTNYAAARTAITPLGNVQELQLGQKLRSIYLNASSPSAIQGFNTTLADQNQIQVRADAGGEGGVIFDSAVSLLQGMFPATTSYNTTLANGTTVVGPLGGYQYVPVESVEPGNDISLEGWTSCSKFDEGTQAFYASEPFKQMAAEHADFLQQLGQYMDGRPVTFDNMWNIFDYMNVESIHDANFLKALPPTFLAQARALTNWHQYRTFSSPQIDGIGNIAGRAILPSILSGLTRISNSSDPLKMVYESISYKPFVSLFNMTGVAQQNPELEGFVNYAASLVFEVRQPSSGGPTLRFLFKNGTDDDDFKQYNFMGGSGDIPLSTFVDAMTPAAINSTTEWCQICNNNKDRGCGAIAAAMTVGAQSNHIHQRIGPVGSGFLGAGLTIVVIASMLGVLAFLGLLTVGKASKRKSKSLHSDHGSVEKA
ncbi:hypothetical protein HGRIS_005885 [Hohenbuehelia grisea]|uniref:Phosphoglycerate mutase-like protein n=1 Tax=Hohenbuehelia grisea TaxID=104357 RepID=A0ABR3JZM7_9AGAR